MGKLYQHKWRTVKYKNSFFPSAIADWNKLSVDLVLNDSLSKFKKYLNNKFFTDNRLFDYNIISGARSKSSTQIRLGLSPLGEHLYTYNLSDNPFCQNCLSIVKSTAHFLFHCDKYDQERVALMNNPHVAKLNLHPNNSSDIDGLVNTFIRGRGNSTHLLTRLFGSQLPDSSPIRSASITSNNIILSIIL